MWAIELLIPSDAARRAAMPVGAERICCEFADAGVSKSRDWARGTLQPGETSSNDFSNAAAMMLHDGGSAILPA